MAQNTRATEPSALPDERLEHFAHDLGTLLGHAQNKADSWLGQRKAIAEQLVGVRDTASRLLAQLGVTDAAPPAKRGRKPGSKNRVKATVAASNRPAKKERTMSAEAREKIAAAQRKRWAKQKKAAGKG